MANETCLQISWRLLVFLEIYIQEAWHLSLLLVIKVLFKNCSLFFLVLYCAKVFLWDCYQLAFSQSVFCTFTKGEGDWYLPFYYYYYYYYYHYFYVLATTILQYRSKSTFLVSWYRYGVVLAERYFQADVK